MSGGEAASITIAIWAAGVPVAAFAIGLVGRIWKNDDVGLAIVTAALWPFALFVAPIMAVAGVLFMIVLKAWRIGAGDTTSVLGQAWEALKPPKREPEDK